jgi:hypothetical protein
MHTLFFIILTVSWFVLTGSTWQYVHEIGQEDLRQTSGEYRQQQ